MPEMCKQCSDRRAQLQFMEQVPATVFSFPYRKLKCLYKLSKNLFMMVLSKTFIKRHNFKCLSLSIVLPIRLHVCFALLTAGVVVGSVGGCRPDTATKPNNESSRSERGFIHFIFLWLDSALDRGRVPIWSPQ